MDAIRKEIMRLIREDFDPTPVRWEGRDWYDNAEEVADKIVALFPSEKHAQASDCEKCGGDGNLFTQQFDRDGNERVTRCPCVDSRI